MMRGRISISSMCVGEIQSDLEMGTEFIFFVRAFTRVGPGSSTSVVVSTLEPCEKKYPLASCALLSAFLIYSCSRRSCGDSSR